MGIPEILFWLSDLGRAHPAVASHWVAGGTACAFAGKVSWSIYRAGGLLGRIGNCADKGKEALQKIAHFKATWNNFNWLVNEYGKEINEIAKGKTSLATATSLAAVQAALQQVNGHEPASSELTTPGRSSPKEQLRLFEHEQGVGDDRDRHGLEQLPRPGPRSAGVDVFGSERQAS
jgi:hypothetical protein